MDLATGPPQQVDHVSQPLRVRHGGLAARKVGVPADERPGVWTEIEQALSRLETAAGFEGPCERLWSPVAARSDLGVALPEKVADLGEQVL